MSGVRVRVEGIPRVRKLLLRVTGEGKAAVRRAIRVSATNIQTGAKQRLTTEGAVDRGTLRNSIATDYLDEGMSARIGTNAPHAPATEFGARPHWAPIGPLKEWAKRHGLPENVAYAIQSKIAREGTKPRPYMIPAFEEEIPKYRARLRRELGDAVVKASR